MTHRRRGTGAHRSQLAASAAVSPDPLPLSLYVHVPWCVRKCPYCDFNSHASGASRLPEATYVSALLADLDFELRGLPPRPLQSIFIGGGTPSLFSAEAIGRLLRGIGSRLDLAIGCEITLEANPGTVEARRFAGFRAAGINRLSIGAQSFHSGHLKALGRIHDGTQSRRAIQTARSAGFSNLNIDLMFGLPEQTVTQAVADATTACELDPTHVSLYQLTIEPNTYFATHPPELPDEDTIWNMFEACRSVLDRADYTQYEVSAYARAGHRCRHNLNYWRFGDYLGIGAGAHGKVTDRPSDTIVRRARVRQPRRYLDTAGTAEAIASSRGLGLEDRIVEYMMNALRLVEGVGLREALCRTGLGRQDLEPGLGRARSRALLVPDRDRIQATPLGLRFLNDLLAGFVPDGSA